MPNIFSSAISENNLVLDLATCRGRPYWWHDSAPKPFWCKKKLPQLFPKCLWHAGVPKPLWRWRADVFLVVRQRFSVQLRGLAATWQIFLYHSPLPSKFFAGDTAARSNKVIPKNIKYLLNLLLSIGIFCVFL